jgi:asparagine synthetase B (glutamine-hydrolysing)
LYDERYRSQTVFESPDCGIGYTAYPTYPVEVVRIDGYLITFEGYIYDWDHGELRSELRTLFDRSDEFRDRAVISEWLRTTDGEFVLIAVDEGTDEITVIGDCLGRLPLYYAETGDGIAISRAHRFVTEWLYGTNTETAAADGGSDSATTNTRQNTSAESAANRSSIGWRSHSSSCSVIRSVIGRSSRVWRDFRQHHTFVSPTTVRQSNVYTSSTSIERPGQICRSSATQLISLLCSIVLVDGVRRSAHRVPRTRIRIADR